MWPGDMEPITPIRFTVAYLSGLVFHTASSRHMYLNVRGFR